MGIAGSVYAEISKSERNDLILLSFTIGLCIVPTLLISLWDSTNWSATALMTAYFLYLDSRSQKRRKKKKPKRRHRMPGSVA